MSDPKVFLDTSALFAGIWSETGGSRQLLRLGEADVIDLSVGPSVLDEIESVLRDKAPDMLGELTVLLDRAGITVVNSAPNDRVEELNQYLDYRPDAIVLAEASAAGIDWFISYDRDDFLDNKPLTDAVSFQIATAGDFLQQLKQDLD